MNSKYIIAITLLLLISSCSGIGKSLVKSPDLSVTHISISKLSTTEQKINLKLRIDNPNPFTLPIRGFRYNFFVNNNEFIEGFYNNSFDIRSNGNSEIDLKLSGDLLSLIKKLDLTLLKKIDYTISGDISLLTENLKFPYEYKGEVSILSLL